MGLDAETGVFMLLFLDLAHEEAKAKGRLRNRADLIESIIHGAVKRVRPKTMTVCAAFIGLLPIMWSTGTGADLMKRIAAPMVGGLVTSFALELLVYPAVYLLWKDSALFRAPRVAARGPGAAWNVLPASEFRSARRGVHGWGFHFDDRKVVLEEASLRSASTGRLLRPDFRPGETNAINYRRRRSVHGGSTLASSACYPSRCVSKMIVWAGVGEGSVRAPGGTAWSVAGGLLVRSDPPVGASPSVRRRLTVAGRSELQVMNSSVGSLWGNPRGDPVPFGRRRRRPRGMR